MRKRTCAILARSVAVRLVRFVVAAWLLLVTARSASAARIVRNVWTSSIYRGQVTLTAGYGYQFRTTDKDSGVDPVMVRV
ncbi:MAG: hypothetical protein HYV09_07585 [Deltaproteobacteria bacterium]|nr:hypothetical protein [Deltaproteobacteria bacterium]